VRDPHGGFAGLVVAVAWGVSVSIAGGMDWAVPVRVGVNGGPGIGGAVVGSGGAPGGGTGGRPGGSARHLRSIRAFDSRLTPDRPSHSRREAALWSAVAAVLAVVAGLAVGTVPRSWGWAHDADVLWAATGSLLAVSAPACPGMIATLMVTDS